MAATIRDIAAASGVSVATVSRYINGNGYVSEESAEKLQRVIAELGYRPSRAAQSLKSKESHSLVLIVPDIENPFYAKIARTVQHRADREGYTITLTDSEGSLAWELRGIETASRIQADGILLASSFTSEEVLQALHELNKPTVLLNAYDTCEFDTVHGARGESTGLATKYLIDCGHRHIGFAGGESGRVTSESRKTGYLQAMQAARLHAEPTDIFHAGLSWDSGLSAAAYFAALPTLPTAICCANDLIAMGLIQGLSQRGIRVPQDVSITGVDDIVYASLCSPMLTTVKNDSEQFGVLAVEAVLRRIRAETEEPPREYIVRRRLVVRDSVKKIWGPMGGETR